MYVLFLYNREGSIQVVMLKGCRPWYSYCVIRGSEVQTMLKKSDMNIILANASKRISSYDMEQFEEGRAEIDKYFSVIQKGMGDSLKDTKFLYSTGKVEGVFTKKFKFAILFSADTFYYFESKYGVEKLVIKYSDIAKVSGRNVTLTVTLKDGTKVKTSSYQAVKIAILLDELFKYIHKGEDVAPDPVESKKKTVKANVKPSVKKSKSETKEKAEAEHNAKEAKAKADAERKAKEAEVKAKAEAERKAKEAEVKAKAEAERKAKEAEAKAKAEAERKAKEAEAKAKADAERKAKEAEAKAKAEAERKAKEAEVKAKAEAERKANEAAEKMIKFTRTKPHNNLFILGHIDHGKSTLTAAITEVLRRNNDESKPLTVEQLDDAQISSPRGLEFASVHISYESAAKHYTQVDCPGYADWVKGIISGGVMADSAILVVSAVEGPMSQTKDLLRLAEYAGVRNIILFINKCDLLDDDELIELIEMEAMELIESYPYAENVYSVRGSALDALNNPTGPASAPIIEIFDHLDEFDEPIRDSEKPFLMPIEDVFTIPGRGSVATGRIESGTIKANDTVDIVGFNPEVDRAVVTAIEMFKKILDFAESGDNVGLLLRGVSKDSISRGMVLSAPGAIEAHTKFKALIYLISKSEGGIKTPIVSGYRPTFYFRTTDVTGELTLPQGCEFIMPGDATAVTVNLVADTPMSVGDHFSIRVSGRRIAVGVVTEIINDDLIIE